MAKKQLIYLILFIAVFHIAVANHVPRPIGYVNDFADIISDDYQVGINNLINEIEKNTTIEIAVATVDSLKGDAIENFAVELFKEWGIGEKNKDNGLLILIANAERQYRIEVGYGLEGILNDAKVGRIAREYLIPNLQAGNFGKGIYDSLIEINKELNEDYTGNESLLEYNYNLPLFIIIVIIYFTMLILIYKHLKKNKKMQDYLGTFHIFILIILFFVQAILFTLFLIVTIFFVMFLLGAKKNDGTRYPSHWGYGGFGRSSGGFGGFGGGSSGGGGVSGRF
ncbi:MAG: TPM domain-containing protein, partial [Nanoarchaeota archaeon]